MRFQNYSYLYSRFISLICLIGITVATATFSLNYWAKKKEHILSQFNPSHIWKGIKQEINPSNIKQEKIDVIVKNGDTLGLILKNNGISSQETAQIIAAMQRFYNVKKLSVGQALSLSFKPEKIDQNLILDSLLINLGYGKQLEIYRSNNNLLAREIITPLKKFYTTTEGTIKSSFIATANSLGIPTKSLNELIKAYSYNIDFQRDIKSGSSLKVIFEQFYDEQGVHSHDGDVLFVSLTLNEKNYNLYKYATKSGKAEFYTEDGNHVKKELLKTPVSVVKISSGFGMRHHPILGYSKMHKGVDFAAPIGTPILAAGNGVIEEIGWKGTYGNYIRIKHSNGYSTAYAHASAFVKNLRRGSTVKQGDVIAYVGATGQAKGAHLHYELLLNNVHVNPLNLKLAPTIKLSGSELSKFLQFRKKVDNYISSDTNSSEIVATIFDINN